MGALVRLGAVPMGQVIGFTLGSCLIGGPLLWAGIATMLGVHVPFFSGPPLGTAALGLLIVAPGLYVLLWVNELSLDPDTRTYTLRRGPRPLPLKTKGSFDDFDAVTTGERYQFPFSFWALRPGVRVSEVILVLRSGARWRFLAESSDAALSQAQAAALNLGIPLGNSYGT